MTRGHQGFFNADNIFGKPPNSPRLEDVYKLDKVLGKGSFGTVRVAVHRATREVCACKTISKSKMLCREDALDVQREVQIMAALGNHHPGIVRIIDTFEDAKNCHVILEVCAGGELFTRISKRGKYTEQDAAEAFAQMVDIVMHCHDSGVIHRDLKPENFLLVGQEGQPGANTLKATDFGLSVWFQKGTVFSELAGTPYYLAPEVLRKRYNHQCDMWSMGVILYIMLSGLPPFWGRNEQEIFNSILRGRPDFHQHPWPLISPEAKDCIQRLLVLDPNRRATARQIAGHKWLAQSGYARNTHLGDDVLMNIKRFAAMNKLQKVSLLVLGQCLDMETLNNMRELFTRIDKNKNGTISHDELKAAMREWGHMPSDEEVDAVLRDADVSGDGVIDYNEFVASTMHIKTLQDETLLQRAFREMDADRSGFITYSEVAACMTHFGITDADVRGLVNAADTNKDGSIDYEELAALVRQGHKDLLAAAHAVRMQAEGHPVPVPPTKRGTPTPGAQRRY